MRDRHIPFPLRPPVPFSLSFPNQAWCESTGDDSTGEVGNPAKPYRTAQAAYNDGALCLNLGSGDFGSLTFNEPLAVRTVSLRGVKAEGSAPSEITSIIVQCAMTVRITDIGYKSVLVGNVIAQGVNGANGGAGLAGSNGGVGPSIYLNNIYTNNVSVSGGVGGTGGSGNTAGGIGGAGGNLFMEDCIAVDCSVNGGDGGQGSGNGNGGKAGSGGTLSSKRCNVVNLKVNTGTPGNPGGGGGGSIGLNGNGGTLYVEFSDVSNMIDASGVVPGSIVAKFSYVNTVGDGTVQSIMSADSSGPL